MSIVAANAFKLDYPCSQCSKVSEIPSKRVDETTYSVPYAPLVTHPWNGGYYLPAKSIRVGWNAVQGVAARWTSTSTRAAAASCSAPPRGVCTGVKRVPAVWPFELCYDLEPLGRYGIDVVVPLISLELPGATWHFDMESYLVFIERRFPRNGVGCAGVVEMNHAAGAAGGVAVEDQPAVVLGTMQLQERLLVFDLDKGVLGFSDLMRNIQATCSAL
ncbi:hypothetical protein QOZ80_1BG0095990 [Eleusine coracana subsp. coracana]|nr:hypothetical protein QOZ80_1BG0095990 [Eleusine coracana subsp. coracana]